MTESGGIAARDGAAETNATVLHPCAWAVRRPLVLIALCWMGGIAAGSWLPFDRVWLLISGCMAAIMLCAVAARRDRTTRYWGMLAVVCAAAAWMAVRANFISTDDIQRWIDTPSQLAQVTGVVDGPTYLVSSQRGALGRFSYQPPATLLVLNLETIRIGDADKPVRGRLLVKVEEADYRLRAGDRIRATGWLGAIEGPYNPGEIDYRKIYVQRGIAGRLILRHRNNWQPLPRPLISVIPMLSEWLGDQGDQSLQLGLSYSPERLALLQTVLLGRRTPDLAELDQSFRHIGLAHVLSIAGLHLGILLGTIWLLAAAVTGRPTRAALAAFVVLVIYLMIVPSHVPLIRAGIMAALLTAAYALGRRFSGVEALALSALLILLWRPEDLFDPGFQLSFVAVGSLLLFTRPLSRRIYPDPLVLDPLLRRRHLMARWCSDYLAANVVAAVITIPVVAYHFGMVSPLAVLISLVALPLVALVLTLGFFKIIIGLVLPTLGTLLARPLEWSASALIMVVERASSWRFSWIPLVPAPGAIWAVSATIFLALLLGGWFAGRRVAPLLSAALLTGWLFAANMFAQAETLLHAAPTAPRMAVNMFTVGNGSCYLVRLHAPPPFTGQYTLMYDCGSGEFMDVGTRSIAPALRSLGVNHINSLMISHADADHFCGAIDVMDQVSVDRVVTTPYFLGVAAANPPGAPAAFLHDVESRHVPIAIALRGWHESVVGAELDLLWPPPGLIAPKHNDTCLVLSIRSAGRRLLLNGDIQQPALLGLLANGPEQLHADITELPHHGSFVEASPRWFAAVSPSVVLQSTGLTRLLYDKWAGRFDHSVTRLVTQWGGMAEVDVANDGGITCSTFRDPQSQDDSRLQRTASDRRW